MSSGAHAAQEFWFPVCSPPVRSVRASSQSHAAPWAGLDTAGTGEDTLTARMLPVAVTSALDHSAARVPMRGSGPSDPHADVVEERFNMEGVPMWKCVPRGHLGRPRLCAVTSAAYERRQLGSREAPRGAPLQGMIRPSTAVCNSWPEASTPSLRVVGCFPPRRNSAFH